PSHRRRRQRSRYDPRRRPRPRLPRQADRRRGRGRADQLRQSPRRAVLSRLPRQRVRGMTAAALPRPVSAVIFDMDGLLCDTEIIYRDAMMEAARTLGRDLPLAVFLTMVGTTD